MRKDVDILTIIFTVAIVFALDQLTKFFVKSSLMYGETIYLLGDLLKLTHVRNDGIAFGFLQGKFYLIIVMISLTIILLITFAVKLKSLSKLSKIFLGMIIGGALGNFTDRLLHQNVVDFISVFDFPIFNIADSSIVLGTIFFGIRLLFHEKLESDDEDESGDDDRKIHSNDKGERMATGQISHESVTFLDIPVDDSKSDKNRKDTG
ncbi:MAG: signal peptidase [Thermotogaceae bacterium]|nr:signal peptidase [Thermotogaceae bacterium]MDN5338290.1 signal peptidase [Thermotogaceae bacterium]